MNKTYTNYISLGYFCEVAQDLEKLGLRNQSSPFDWGISYFANVIDVIDKEFLGFMDYDNLSQSINDRAHYHEDIYQVKNLMRIIDPKSSIGLKIIMSMS